MTHKGLLRQSKTYVWRTSGNRVPSIYREHRLWEEALICQSKLGDDTYCVRGSREHVCTQSLHNRDIKCPGVWSLPRSYMGLLNRRILNQDKLSPVPSPPLPHTTVCPQVHGPNPAPLGSISPFVSSTYNSYSPPTFQILSLLSI